MRGLLNSVGRARDHSFVRPELELRGDPGPVEMGGDQNFFDSLDRCGNAPLLGREIQCNKQTLLLVSALVYKYVAIRTHQPERTDAQSGVSPAKSNQLSVEGQK